MKSVIDASITLSWYFEDERSEQSDRVLDLVTENGAVVPGPWQLVVANGFRTGIRRKRIDMAFRDNALQALASLPIALDAETDAQSWTGILALADRFDLTPYDAAYLELAHRRALPLATADRDLQKAATRLGVSLVGV